MTNQPFPLPRGLALERIISASAQMVVGHYWNHQPLQVVLDGQRHFLGDELLENDTREGTVARSLLIISERFPVEVLDFLDRKQWLESGSAAITAANYSKMLSTAPVGFLLSPLHRLAQELLFLSRQRAQSGADPAARVYCYSDGVLHTIVPSDGLGGTIPLTQLLQDQHGISPHRCAAALEALQSELLEVHRQGRQFRGINPLHWWWTESGWVHTGWQHSDGWDWILPAHFSVKLQQFGETDPRFLPTSWADAYGLNLGASVLPSVRTVLLDQLEWLQAMEKLLALEGAPRIHALYEKCLHSDFFIPFAKDVDQVRFAEHLHFTMRSVLAHFVAELPPEPVAPSVMTDALSALVEEQAEERPPQRNVLKQLRERLAPLWRPLKICVGVIAAVSMIWWGLSSWDWDRPAPERLVDDSTFYALMDVIQSNEGTAAEKAAKEQLQSYFEEQQQSIAEAGPQSQALFAAAQQFWAGKTSGDGVRYQLTRNITNGHKLPEEIDAQLILATQTVEVFGADLDSKQHSIVLLNQGMWMMAVCLQDSDKELCAQGRELNEALYLNRKLSTWVRVEAAMNAMFTQRHQLESSILNAEAAQKSCGTMMNALSKHHQYENLRYAIQVCIPQAKDRKQQLDWAIAYRRSRLTMNRAQLIDDFIFPDCTDKKWQYKTPDSWTAEDKYSYCSWLSHSLSKQEVQPLPEGLEFSVWNLLTGDVVEDRFGWKETRDRLNRVKWEEE